MLIVNLPVDLIAEILSELDLDSLIKVSYASKQFHTVASDPSLNPWRRPILRNLRSTTYESALKHLSVRLIVPRQNWIDILSVARPSFILYEATLPNLKSSEWEECYKRRFLPGWRKWRKDSPWKEVFLKVLHRVWHRGVTSCTSDEAWTKYIVLNRNGIANELEASSRNYNPFTVFNEMKLQNDLSQFETCIKLVVELTDVRIFAFGTLARPRSDLTVNSNAHLFLHPPGVKGDGNGNIFTKLASMRQNRLIIDHGAYPMSTSNFVPAYLCNEYVTPSTTYSRLTHPQPAPVHVNYPFFTPGGGDLRWSDSAAVDNGGLCWVGGLMIIAQLLGPPCDADSPLHGRQQYASFTWSDLWAIAPWLEERITKKIDGAGLGH